jgi:D-alanine-D-alanine ligase
MRVILIAGGWSDERDVSLAGAAKTREALENLGHDVVFCDLARDFGRLMELVREADFAFLNLHGSPGEDGLIQAMLDVAGCPYQGSGPAASFLALHKAGAKQIFADHGLDTPAWAFLPVRPEPGWQPDLSYPLFVKPNTGGSSLDMSLASTPEELDAALAVIFDHGREALVEESARGDELTCAVLGEEALPVILVKPSTGAFFDYASKYQPGGAEETCPAPIPDELRDRVQAQALAVHRLLGLGDYSRADFIHTPDDRLMLLEVNTLPGMTPTSLVPQAAAAAGYSFEDLLARLVELGMAKSA